MKNLNTLHIYCTDGVKEKLEKLAEADRRSLSAEVQMLIEQAYAAFISKSKDDLKR